MSNNYKQKISSQKIMGWIMTIAGGIITPIVTYLMIINEVFELTDLFFVGIGSFVTGWGISWIRKKDDREHQDDM